MTAPTRERILPRLIEDEMRESFLDYSMSVIVQRALPDVRDGLKPVHRRILWAMHDANLRPDRPFVKCARVVGEVMANYHPHGDTAIYEALVRMGQTFSLTAPLIDKHGNFGSPSDPPAASRYTECRLSALAMELLAGIDEGTVDNEPNYDGSRSQPVVLPARFPNLLVNGAQGIAVGMATNIPPHKLAEVPFQTSVDAIAGKLAELVESGKIDGVRDIRNESGQGKTRLVIELRNDTNPQIVLNNLFKHTAAQSTFSVNMVALIDSVPHTVTLVE